MTRAEALSKIADYLADALQGTDEALELAKQEFGEKDALSEACLEAWAEVETAFQLVETQQRACVGEAGGTQE